MSRPRWQHVRVRDETAERLERMAEREGSSKAAVVEKLVKEAEDEKPTEKENAADE